MRVPRIIPYIPNDGILPVKDSFILAVWDQMMAECTAKTVFFDGTVNNGVQFLNNLKQIGNVAYLGFADNDFAGLFWINAIRNGRAFIHFCIMRAYWGRDAVTFGKLALDVVGKITTTEGLPLLQLVTGVTAASNAQVIRYAKSLGMVECGRVRSFLFNARLNRFVDAVFLSYFFERGTEPASRPPAAIANTNPGGRHKRDKHRHR